MDIRSKIQIRSQVDYIVKSVKRDIGLTEIYETFRSQAVATNRKKNEEILLKYGETSVKSFIKDYCDFRGYGNFTV